MKALRLDAPNSQLIETTEPQPKPAPDQVLVRVYAAGLTPTELAWYPTSHTRDGGVRTSPVLAHEFAGRIAELGANVSGFSIGQSIFGMNDWFEDGALAGFCLTRPEWVAPMPEDLTYPEAASLPIGALTAWQGLFDRAKLKADERVLIHGAAGAVGIYAVQLAHSCGARVVATASARDTDFVKDLGASEVLDYRAQPFEDHISAIDVVFDTVGGDSLLRSWSVLKPGGRLITVAAQNENALDDRTKQAFFIVEPNGAQLTEVSKLIESSRLRPYFGTVLPFSRASEAYFAKPNRLRPGKLVVSLADSTAR